MDFNPCAYPHRDGIEMRNGLGDLKGFTLKRVETAGSSAWEIHEAYACTGDQEKVVLIGSHADMWAAYGMIEVWYETEDYYEIFDAA